MKNNETVSVIIPIYKVEKYLEKCVKSVTSQTYKNLEIILVDDGSPDDCPKICDDLARQDQRIRVIHKQNGGLSSARNAGLDIATGQYIYFLDSDDYIEPETIDTMITTMNNNNVDIVVAGVRPFYTDNDKPTTFDGMVNYFNMGETSRKLDKYQFLHMPAVASGKLYKKSIIEEYNLRFDEGLINEDESFNWYYNTKIKNGLFIPNKFYNYLIRNDSIMGNKQNKGNKIGDMLHIIDNVHDHLVMHHLLNKYQNKFRKWALSTISGTKWAAQEFKNQDVFDECNRAYDKYNTRKYLGGLIYIKYSRGVRYVSICGIRVVKKQNHRF